MATTPCPDATHDRCTVCGASVNPDVARAQKEEPGEVDSPSCRECLEEVPDHPQLETLYEQIEEELREENVEKWREGSREDRLFFVLSMLEKDKIEGGSPGFHHELRKYLCLWLADHEGDL